VTHTFDMIAPAPYAINAGTSGASGLNVPAAKSAPGEKQTACNERFR